MKDEPMIRPAHLALALNVGDRTLISRVLQGSVPRPDARGHAGLKLWKLSTIRNWRPDVADAIEALLKIPAFEPKPIHWQ